jgi:carboxynorspermidine decarboxylase
LKGFAAWKTFPILREYGFDSGSASSLHEARLIHEELAGMAYLYAPAYKKTEFEELLSYANHVTFNSWDEFDRFFSLIKKHEENVSTGIRVNPGVSSAPAGIYDPSQPGTRLGLQASQLPEKLPDGVKGFHFHTLCESDSYMLEKVLHALDNKFGKYLPTLEWLNMGGGHLITSQRYDIDHLVFLLNNYKKKYPRLQIILEPGSAFAWRTGYLVSTILDIVEDSGIKTAVLDVSFTAHMPDCLEMPYKPKILGARQDEAGKYAYRMGGASCLAGDYMGNWHFDEALQVGQKIIFDDMVHYTMVKTTFFNGIQHPSIGMWKMDNSFELFRKFGYEDYKGKLS